MSKSPRVSVHSGKSAYKIQKQTPQRPTTKTPRKHFSWRWFFFICFALVITFGAMFAYRIHAVYSEIFVNKSDNSFLDQLQNTIKGGLDLTELHGESSGQVNVLLLGIGGEGHDGGYLTDSMILAQLRPRDKKVSLVHIPRDLWADVGSGSFQKINSAFAYGFSAGGGSTSGGEQPQAWDEAGERARTAVEKISGLTIPYFAVIDFSGFKDAIDSIGGIDVTIDNTFSDSSYPDNKYGYIPTVTFIKGIEHMDGKRALIFTRSRHGTFPEGTDFARGARQQKVIAAVKDKVKKLNLVTDIHALNKLISVFADHFHTNINPGEILRAYNLVKDYNQTNIISLSLDQQSGILCDQTHEETGAYILSYCDGKSIADLQEYFTDAFQPNPMQTEKPKIYVLSTSSAGLQYAKTALELRKEKFIWTYYYYKALPADATVFYQSKPKPLTAEALKTRLGYTEVFTLPSDLKTLTEKADIIIFTREENK